MKKMVCIFAMVLALLVGWSGGASAAGGIEGNINLLMGQKNLDKNDWEPVEEQTAIGLMFDITPAGSPIALAIDLLSTEDSTSYFDGYDWFQVRGETQEIDLGIRWYTPPHVIRGYVGGGLALINAEIKVDNASEEDDAIGYFINGGVVCTLARHLNLGLNVRYSAAKVDIAGIDVEAGGLTLAGVVGFHF
jgi:hypothetical protein